MPWPSTAVVVVVDIASNRLVANQPDNSSIQCRNELEKRQIQQKPQPKPSLSVSPSAIESNPNGSISPPGTATPPYADPPLQDFSQPWIRAFYICMMYTDVSLQIIRPWVSVFTIWAKWTHIAGRFVDQAVPYHFVLSFEALACIGAWAVRHGAVVRPRLRVNCGMGAVKRVLG